MASKNYAVNHWAVGFLDLLGQRRALCKMDFLPDNRDEAKVAELIEAVRGSVVVIDRFFRLYDVFREGRDRSTPSDRFRDAPPEVLRLASETLAYDLRDARFSDGLVVYSSLVSSPEHGAVNGLYQLMCASGALMLTSLSWNHPIRGGLDVGTGVEVERGQLHGPAVVKAYVLESERAEYPRIVVGDTLVDYLRWQCDRTGDVRVQLDSHLAGILRRMLKQDTDGLTILDYMGRTFRDKVAFEINPKIIHDAQQFATTEFEKHRAAGDQKLADRYERLVGYFERNVDAWIGPAQGPR